MRGMHLLVSLYAIAACSTWGPHWGAHALSLKRSLTSTPAQISPTKNFLNGNRGNQRDTPSPSLESQDFLVTSPLHDGVGQTSISSRTPMKLRNEGQLHPDQNQERDAINGVGAEHLMTLVDAPPEAMMELQQVNFKHIIDIHNFCAEANTVESSPLVELVRQVKDSITKFCINPDANLRSLEITGSMIDNSKAAAEILLENKLQKEAETKFESLGSVIHVDMAMGDIDPRAKQSAETDAEFEAFIIDYMKASDEMRLDPNGDYIKLRSLKSCGYLSQYTGAGSCFCRQQQQREGNKEARKAPLRESCKFWKAHERVWNTVPIVNVNVPFNGLTAVEKTFIDTFANSNKVSNPNHGTGIGAALLNAQGTVEIQTCESGHKGNETMLLFYPTIGRYKEEYWADTRPSRLQGKDADHSSLDVEEDQINSNSGRTLLSVMREGPSYSVLKACLGEKYHEFKMEAKKMLSRTGSEGAEELIKNAEEVSYQVLQEMDLEESNQRP